VTVAGKDATDEAPDAASAGRRLRLYFLAAALMPSVVALPIALATGSGAAAAWLAGCAAAGLLVALATTKIAVRRVIVPLDGVAAGVAAGVAWPALTADRLKSTFVANMRHEIRTPLNSVLALSELLRDGGAGPLTAEQRRYLEIITRNGHTLLRLIDDILDLSRIESGYVELDTEDVDLTLHIAAVVEALSPLAMEKDLDVTIKLPHDLPRARCDVDRVRQILTNLVGNAIKFTDSGTVRVTAQSTPSAVAIFVTDTGIGIPENQLARIFDEFMQVDQSLARRQAGTGLGLAIASRLAHLMGGDISVSSVHGSGSRFTLTLPRAGDGTKRVNVSGLSTAAETVDDIRREAYAPGSRQAPITVLIVEDNEDNLFTLREMLAPLSFEIATATTGRQAIEYCRMQLPDLVITDVQMPGMSGLQATGAIRALPGGADVPILALTAQAMKGDRERILSAGVDEYLAKPVAPRELRAAVTRLIAPRRPDVTIPTTRRGQGKEEPRGAHTPRR
jgi:two-component system sensor histidine kinase ChiS